MDSDKYRISRIPQEWIDLEEDLYAILRQAGECLNLGYDSSPDRTDGQLQTILDLASVRTLQEVLEELSRRVDTAKAKTRLIERGFLR